MFLAYKSNFATRPGSFRLSLLYRQQLPACRARSHRRLVPAYTALLKMLVKGTHMAVEMVQSLPLPSSQISIELENISFRITAKRINSRQPLQLFGRISINHTTFSGAQSLKDWFFQPNFASMRLTTPHTQAPAWITSRLTKEGIRPVNFCKANKLSGQHTVAH